MMHFRFTTWAGLPGKFHSRDALRLASLVLLATAAFGQTYNASVFAGVWLPENLPGASVSLNGIGGVAVDAAGNVFLSLPEYAAVMRLDATTGILTRVAGNATNGFSGDNGPAVNAQLYAPNGLAPDPAGNLYIADRSRCRAGNPARRPAFQLVEPPEKAAAATIGRPTRKNMRYWAKAPHLCFIAPRLSDSSAFAYNALCQADSGGDFHETNVDVVGQRDVADHLARAGAAQGDHPRCP